MVFMLRTAMLDRLSAPLCEFVTGERNASCCYGLWIRKVTGIATTRFFWNISSPEAPSRNPGPSPAYFPLVRFSGIMDGRSPARDRGGRCRSWPKLSWIKNCGRYSGAPCGERDAADKAANGRHYLVAVLPGAGLGERGENDSAAPLGVHRMAST